MTTDSNEPDGVANLRAILDDQPYQNSLFTVAQIKIILENRGGFMPDEAVIWFREWNANAPMMWQWFKCFWRGHVWQYVPNRDDDYAYLGYTKCACCGKRYWRRCTCHPADNPPIPCARKYALTECRNSPASSAMRNGMDRWKPKSGSIIGAKRRAAKLKRESSHDD